MVDLFNTLPSIVLKGRHYDYDISKFLNMFCPWVQLNKYETAPNFILFSQKLDIGLFVDLAEFPCFVPVLAWPDHKIVLFLSAEQFYDHIMQELVKTGKFS